MSTLESIRQNLAKVLHLKESPHRTALAFAIGVFIAFAPHYLFHTASVLFVAWAFRLNYVAVFLGSFINNPWTLVPILGASLYTGLIITGGPTQVSIDWNQLTTANVWDIFLPYLLPFLVGASILAVLGALLAYPLMRWLVARYRHRKVRQ